MDFIALTKVPHSICHNFPSHILFILNSAETFPICYNVLQTLSHTLSKFTTDWNRTAFQNCHIISTKKKALPIRLKIELTCIIKTVHMHRTCITCNHCKCCPL